MHYTERVNINGDRVMDNQFIQVIQYKNKTAGGPDIQERINRFMERKNQRRGFIKTLFAGIWAGINWILIGLGAAAFTSLILAFIFPEAAGDVIAWAIHAGMEWARGLK